MRIVFMGTPAFAVASLDILVNNGYNVVGVVTAPDKPAGRGQQLQQSEVKKYALSHHLHILQPANLKEENFLNALRELKADLQLVVAFRMLPEIIWNMPPLGTYNVHASLLPKYRGAAPINRAIMNGETETGVTTFKLRHEIDAGNILFRDKVTIPFDMTAGELHDILKTKGAELLLRTVREIEKNGRDGNLHFIEQSENEISHAPKIFKENCRINWGKPVKEIYNLIRGLSPYPGAFTTLENHGSQKTLKIFRSTVRYEEHRQANGLINTNNKDTFQIFCDGGILEVQDLQLEGKKRMPVTEFLKGCRIQPGAKLLSE